MKIRFRSISESIAVLAIATVGVAVFCVLAQHGLADSGVPTLTEIVPNSGQAGKAYPLQATIHGTGFLSTGNEINFGPSKIADVASEDGTNLFFQVPKMASSGGEVPPIEFPPGEYQVTVKTTAGTSNALLFTLTGGG